MKASYCALTHNGLLSEPRLSGKMVKHARSAYVLRPQIIDQ